MSPERFQHLLSLIRDKITKKTTRFRKPLSAEERLVITLRFLATGESQQSLTYAFRVGKATISKVIAETCDAIYLSLGDYIQCPSNAEEWRNVASQFEDRWNFPHAIGAIDGKHIRIECPKKTGSLYHNYKGFFSIVLLAICDANYCFTLFDLGSYGSNNDSGILSHSEMGERFDCEEMNLPDPEPLPGCNYEKLPYFLLGDDIFPLKFWIIRGYGGSNLEEYERIFNYRLSRARRVIENAFGILVARWRIFSKPIRASIQNTERYVLACLALHNYLRKTNNASYTPSVDSENGDGSFRPGDWRETVGEDGNGCLKDINKIRGSRPKESSIDMRAALKGYLNSETGSVEWQQRYIRRTS